jgi:UDP-N-acetylmuramate dehydrogenase
MTAIDSRAREHVALAPLTTLGVGGKARFFLHVDSEASLESGLAWARSSGIPTFILGGGSNVLVSDRGLDGVVIRIGILGVREIAPGLLEAGAGEPFDGFVERSVRAGHGGMECLSGIPGLVGATPIQNVGAYGQEVGDRIVAVRVMDPTTGRLTTFDRSACRFSYRSSIFKEEKVNARVVLAVTFKLAKGPASPIRYAELGRELASRGADPTSLAAVRETVLTIRRSKSMVIDGADPNHRSVGSFFVNPVVDRNLADEIERQVHSPMPRFGDGPTVKLSAAWLVEQAGFAKGFADGAVAISTRHALAIVNRGGATALEILRFAARVRRAVRARFAIALVHEPVLLGFDESEAAELDD